MNRSDFRFAERLRVRWAEIDAQQIVFNGHYLMYVDTAVAGYWRALAMPYAETLHALGGDLYVKKASLEYHASARYDEQIEVGVRCRRIGTSSMVFDAGVFRDDTLLVSGELVYVFADPATQTSRPVPPVLRDVLTGFEAGEPMVAVSVGAWSEQGADARPLRRQVFEREQGVPATLERDPHDDEALHAVARNRFGLPVATGRLVDAGGGVARLGHLAVRPLLRGAGIGATVLQALAEAALQRGDRELVIQAPLPAMRFFSRHGFVVRGEPYDDTAGRRVVDATKPL